ncbi:hypothetical protein C1S70_04330 [Azospirillum argentinense]|uniref:Uncharacterized protein n=1 Tax=Azospirillum argentinense TaxID=2970906 RepID=A0A2K1G5M3_9PROT|nr:hypothetical protein C1S70_04330 [Azospirillum argentinense]
MEFPLPPSRTPCEVGDADGWWSATTPPLNKEARRMKEILGLLILLLQIVKAILDLLNRQ